MNHLQQFMMMRRYLDSKGRSSITVDNGTYPAVRKDSVLPATMVKEWWFMLDGYINSLVRERWKKPQRWKKPLTVNDGAKVIYVIFDLSNDGCTVCTNVKAALNSVLDEIKSNGWTKCVGPMLVQMNDDRFAIAAAGE